MGKSVVVGFIGAAIAAFGFGSNFIIIKVRNPVPCLGPKKERSICIDASQHSGHTEMPPRGKGGDHRRVVTGVIRAARVRHLGYLACVCASVYTEEGQF